MQYFYLNVSQLRAFSELWNNMSEEIPPETCIYADVFLSLSIVSYINND